VGRGIKKVRVNWYVVKMGQIKNFRKNNCEETILKAKNCRLVSDGSGYKSTLD
jgi:hypothetical protein